MPRYDYRCTACAEVIEVVHGMNEAGPERCDTCGGAMRKALSTPAIHFKGSGWAKKDARTAAAAAQKEPAAKGDGDSTPAASPSENGKTDAADAASSDGASGTSSGSDSSDSSGSSGGSGSSDSGTSDNASSKPSAPSTSSTTSSVSPDPG